MGKLIIHQHKITDEKILIDLCPFQAIESIAGKLTINESCRLCRICERQGPPGVVEYQEVAEVRPLINKQAWRGIAVYADHVDGVLHPVTFELIGKAVELAKEIDQPVYVILIGNDINDSAAELLHYGVQAVHLYDQPALHRFRIEPYTSAFVDFVQQIQPAAVLVGATTVGRQLAPRVAARLKTGLTADCTELNITDDGDLMQIRPAFGGNIMAQIVTPNHRPQLATVRYKVMNAPIRHEAPSGNVIKHSLPDIKLKSNVEVLDVIKKQQGSFIEMAEVLIVAGRGIKKVADLALLDQLAKCLGGQLACSRPLAESGWLDAKTQVGLSGRTVRPKLIITCGVSGAIQFLAGMDKSELIIAINNDPEAPIFKVAHYALVGDLYEIIPQLLQQIRAKTEVLA